MGLTAVSMVVLGYLLGSVPFGLVVARVMGAADPRSGGSGNIGATNVARQVGKTAGALTLILDAAKGAVPTALALHYLGATHAALVGLAAFCGHLWPVYLGFKGGKGVATAMGLYLALNPWAFLLTGATFLGVYKWQGYVSLASMVACGSAPVWLLLLGAPRALVIMALVMAGLVVFKHRENIARLRAGTENRFRRPQA